MTENRVKPYRPLGVSLAIILCAGLFSVIPLLNLGMQLLIQNRMANIANTQVALQDGSTMSPVISGGYENIINPTAFVAQMIVCIWILIVCVLAWRGKPQGIRWIFTGSVLILATLTAYLTLRALWVSADIAQGVTSADTVDIFDWANAIFGSVLLPLYTLWYMNRAPARAFFRG